MNIVIPAPVAGTHDLWLGSRAWVAETSSAMT